MNKKEKRKNLEKENYYLIVSRLVGAKGIEETIKIFQSKSMSKYKLKVVGEAAGFSDLHRKIKKNQADNIQFLGRVDDISLYHLYAQAKAFIALAKDEDFGMTVVEAQAAGTPVIAFNGGGFKETVIDGVTGVLINQINKETLIKAINRIEKTKWDRTKLIQNARKFSKEQFISKIKKFVDSRK